MTGNSSEQEGGKGSTAIFLSCGLLVYKSSPTLPFAFLPRTDWGLLSCGPGSRITMNGQDSLHYQWQLVYCHLDRGI